MKTVWILLLFLLGLYVYMMNPRLEGLETTCPTILIQQGERILLQKSIDDKKPIIFNSLAEYVRHVKMQESQGIRCPVLQLQPMKDAQNNLKYQVKSPSLLVDASRNNPPYNTNSYPGFDPQNQTVGELTVLDTIKKIDIPTTPVSN